MGCTRRECPRIIPGTLLSCSDCTRRTCCTKTISNKGTEGDPTADISEIRGEIRQPWGLRLSMFNYHKCAAQHFWHLTGSRGGRHLQELARRKAYLQIVAEPLWPLLLQYLVLCLRSSFCFFDTVSSTTSLVPISRLVTTATGRLAFCCVMLSN